MSVESWAENLNYEFKRLALPMAAVAVQVEKGDRIVLSAGNVPKVMITENVGGELTLTLQMLQQGETNHYEVLDFVSQANEDEREGIEFNVDEFISGLGLE